MDNIIIALADKEYFSMGKHIMFSKRNKMEIEDKNVILIPFYRLKIHTSGVTKTIIVENHFICQIPVEERILLVSRDNGQPSKSFTGTMLEKCSSEPNKLLDMIKEGYKESYKLMSAPTQEKNENKGYYKKFFASEMRRLFFGGWLQKPPVPTIGKNAKLFLLLDLYTSVLGSSPSDAKIASSEAFYLGFHVNVHNRTFTCVDKKYSSYQKILSGLWRKDKIRLNLLEE